MLLVVKPRPVAVVRRTNRVPVVRVRSDVNWPEVTGKYLGVFVLFTSSMNWWFYRTLTRKNKDK